MAEWHDNAPDGSQSVKANNTLLQDNTTYTKTIMPVDHYWNDSDDTDGHHQFVQMPMTGTVAVPTDAALAAAMEGALYAKAIAEANSPDNQDVQPFFIDNKVIGTPGATNIMQLLGIRAMAEFYWDGSDVITNYVFNVAPSPAPGIVHNSTGNFKVTFTNELPSDNYLVLGGCIRDTTVTDDRAVFTVIPSTTNTTKNSLTLWLQALAHNSNSTIESRRMWFVCFGG